MKKSILKYIFTALLFLLNTTLLNAQISFSSELEKFEIEKYTFQNNLELYVKEDSSSALVRVELIVKAGFSSQTPETTGYFPLYTRVLFDIGDRPLINSTCNAESATYITETVPSSLEKTLSVMAKQLISPIFKDNVLKKEYDSMRKEILEYSESTTGFVNCAIDSKIFSEQPWKQESGIYPALFNTNQLSEVRTKLLKLSKEFYTPDNSSLFISGSISAEAVAALVEKYFSEWEKSDFSFQKKEDKKITASELRKFVLLDNAFSDELTQIVIQFTNLNINQTDIVASSFIDITSPYKNAILQNDLLAVRSSSYLTAASTIKNENSRLILQAIMEKPYSLSEIKEKKLKKATVIEQAEAFLSESKKAAALGETDFIRAKSIIGAKYKSESGNSSSLMAYLANLWASGLERNPLEEETVQLIAEKINAEDPFIFLMINPSVYKTQKQYFEEAGYSIITKDNASWYKNELIIKKAFANNNPHKETTESIFFSTAQDYFNKNKELINTYQLKNKIPIIIKKNPEKENVVISISINGGELASPSEERFLRTILINSFAQNIQSRINMLRSQNKFHGDTPLKAWTEEKVSYITINCIKSDLESSLSAVSEAILLGDITPLNADNLVYEQKLQWNQTSSFLDYQMKCAALSALYSGTNFEKLFDASSSILKKTTYRSFSLEYMKLLDSSLYGIVISGDINEKNTIDILENTMGLLKQQSNQNNQPTVIPEVTKTVRKVKLRHTFTTDIPAEFAGPAPEVLVPTKDFTDPVQFWTSCPSDKEQRAVFNALLYNLETRIQEKLKGIADCCVIPASTVLQTACIQCNGILHTSEFKNSFSTAVNELLISLQNKDDAIIEEIKENWILRVMNKTTYEEGTASLIQEGLLCGNPKQYLDNYLAVENADAEQLFSLTEKYFTIEPIYEIYSADSKN